MIDTGQMKTAGGVGIIIAAVEGDGDIVTIMKKVREREREILYF